MKHIHVLTAAALSWPLTIIYWLIPGAYDFPFFFTLLCLAVVYFMPEEEKEITEEEFIQTMREYAVTRVKLCGDVTTDHLKSRAELAGIKAPTPQSWSRVLVKPIFQRVGEVKSQGGHHKIGVYRLEVKA